MNRVACLLAGGLALTAGGCRNAVSGPRVCTAILVYGLNVTVVDASTGERICDAMVVAVDGSYTGAFERVGSGPTCGYAGAPERPGTYEVRVSREGYSPAVARDLHVDADECHVNPVIRTVTLAR